MFTYRDSLSSERMRTVPVRALRLPCLVRLRQGICRPTYFIALQSQDFLLFFSLLPYTETTKDLFSCAFASCDRE
jgi:hypothetical protein